MGIVSRIRGTGLLLAALLGGSAIAGTLGSTSLSPDSARAGRATTVTATVVITDPNYTAGSANVQRLKADGSIAAVVGNLHDDGLNGDAMANDHLYTLTWTVNEANADTLRYQVSAAFKKELKRTFSAPMSLTIEPTTPAPQIVSATLAPGSVSAGVGFTGLATAQLGGPAPTSVVLEKIDAAGRVLVSLGELRDNGSNGDTTAGDGRYALQLPLLEAAPGVAHYRIAAAFPGLPAPLYSGALDISVQGVPTGVTLSTPQNGAYLNTPVITVAGTVQDPGATVKLNGIATPVSNGSFSASVPLNEGPNTINAVATNANGSISTANLLVTLDTTAPKVEIYTPAANGSTASDLVTVSGMVNDIVVGTVNPQQAVVTVNGQAADVLNRSFIARNVPLQVGANTVQAVATDRAGNRATTTINVTRTAAGGAGLRVTGGNNQSGVVNSVLPQPLTVALTDEQGNPKANVPVVFRVIALDGALGTTVAVSGNQSALAVNTDANGVAKAYLRLGSRAGAGNNLVEASAAGLASTADFAASGSPTRAALMVVDSGNNQTGTVGQALPFPLIAIVTDASNNRLANVPVTFAVTGGGGGFGPNRDSTFSTTSDADGRVAASLVLGPTQGVNNNVVEANFIGNTGYPAAFSATALVPGAASETSISGVVLDNSNRPLPGVTMRLLHITQGNRSNIPQEMATAVQTDAQGQFVMKPVPVGVFKLMTDGGTTTRPGTWPTLDFDMITVPGQNNTLGMPIFLPELNPTNRVCVNETTGGTLTLADVPGFALTIAPGSATFPGGSRSGCVSVTPVNMDKVPMAPGFGQQPRFVVTIQPVGTHFSPAARMTIPNVDGLPPRAVTEMYSYDHDLASFVAIGSATVSEDGATITSDVGAGVIKAGWHCGGNPNTAGSAGTCPTCKKCQGASCVNDNAGTCDDGLYCTSADGNAPGADKCLDGSCQGKAIGIQDVANGTLQEWNFTELRNILNGTAEAFKFAPGCSIQPPSFSGAITMGAVSACCEKEKKMATQFKYGGGLSFNGIGAQCLVPGLSFTFLGVFEGGVQVGVGLGGEVTGTGYGGDCIGCKWKVEGNIKATISGSVTVVTKIDPSMIRFEGGVKGTGQVGVSCTCDGCSGSGCLGPITVYGTAILGGFLSKGGEVVIPGTTVCYP
ncbi:hypothetical protein E4L96_04520 [Massilia arenosa]|uniref:Big-1 domain-containing protein n=1 Tax=Zemynaea arenosa TaxID=2561931 RepID=A0A4Y9SQ96_9BURK|nr:choice-of-anchor X domain-containing protein [Massilia arenosa]TFW26271.1 hypothetical protein E4L96_04520 [Massilia arenosa]